MSMRREKVYEEIVGLFIRLSNKYNALERIPVDYGAGKDIYHSERHLLDQIGEHPEKNVTELARFVGVTKGAISQTVKKLENKNLVQRYKGEENDKEVLLKLTETGNEVFETHKAMNLEAIMPFYKHLAKYPDDKVNFLKEIFIWMDSFLDESKTKMESHKKGRH